MCRGRGGRNLQNAAHRQCDDSLLADLWEVSEAVLDAVPYREFVVWNPACVHPSVTGHQVTDRQLTGRRRYIIFAGKSATTISSCGIAGTHGRTQMQAHRPKITMASVFKSAIPPRSVHGMIFVPVGVTRPRGNQNVYFRHLPKVPTAL